MLNKAYFHVKETKNINYGSKVWVLNTLSMVDKLHVTYKIKNAYNT